MIFDFVDVEQTKDFEKNLITFQSVTTKTVLLFLLALLGTWLYQQGRKLSLPGIPGPRPWPIVGNLLQMAPSPHQALLRMRQQYGDVFQVRLGSMSAVVINGRTRVRQAYTSHGEAFGGRPDFLVFQMMNESARLTFARPRPEWAFHKKLARTAVRLYLQNPDRDYEGILQKETASLAARLLDNGGGSMFDPADTIRTYILTVVFSLTFGARVDARNDERYMTLLKLLHQFQKLGETGMIPDVFHWSRPLYRTFGPFQQFKTFTNDISETINALIDDHYDTVDPNKVRDFTDAFIQTAESQKALPGDLTARTLCNTALDLIGGSESTLSAVLGWAVYIACTMPHVQQAVQQEIDQVVGRQRCPDLHDRQNMPLTEATLVEVLRFSSILPMALPHCTTQDVLFAGYHIPKDTVVLFNMQSINKDEDMWEEPESFRPHRFINPETGRVDASKKNLFIPFGAGRRRCLGQKVAEDMYFIFLTTILQKCHLYLAPGQEIDYSGKVSLSLMPVPFKIIATERQ